MILLIHGSDIASSRNFYFEEKNKLKNPVFINGDGITYSQVFQALENNSFFDGPPAIIIENLFSKNKSNTNEFKEITNYLDGKKELNVIIWENSELTKTSANMFKNVQVRNFSFPQNLFLFLDSIKPSNSKSLISLFNDLKKTMEPELILFMMTRQFRLLLGMASSGEDKMAEVKRLAPWQAGKLKKQASYFENSQLAKAYSKLFELDLNHKTGKVSLPVEKSIDFFLLGL